MNCFWFVDCAFSNFYYGEGIYILPINWLVGFCYGSLYFNSVTKTKVKIYAKIGAIPQTMKKRFTVLLLKVFLNPFLLILKAIKAAPFNCTNDVGIPLVMEANKSKLAVIIAIIVA